MKLVLDLTEGQVKLLQTMLYNDTQLDEFSAVASRAIHEKISAARTAAHLARIGGRNAGHFAPQMGVKSDLQ